MENNIFPTIFQSVEFVNDFLQQNYKKKKIQSYKSYAYKNSYPFIYYIKLGETYFQQGIAAPFAIKPVLLFYGLAHWLKASVLVNDPDYPATTQVLAHGVSTRKKKKKDYQFILDEVKIQKDGFFPHIAEKLFQIKLLTGEKYTMNHLLKCIPELLPIIKQLQKELPLLPIKKNNDNWVVSNELLRKLHLTEKQFERKVKEKTNTSIACIVNEGKVHIYQTNKEGSLPIYKSLDERLYIPTQLPLYWMLPEILIHFLLLYNLSMICRYETEWWGELLYSFSTNDRTYIQTFLQSTERKIPNLIKELLIK